MTALVLSEIILPLSAFVVVPMLGLPTAQGTILFGVLAGIPVGIPDVLCIVAVGLLGKEIFQYFQYFLHLTKSSLRAVVDRRFPVGGTIYMIFDKCFLIFSVVEDLLDRLHLLVEVYSRWARICRNAAVLPLSPKPL